jgi:hypothetical protein
MAEWEKVPLGNHNAYYRYTNNKSKIWILIVVLFLVGVYIKLNPNVLAKLTDNIKGLNIGYTLKPRYFCDESNETCHNIFNQLVTNCNNSYFELDTSSETIVMDITNKGDTCNVYCYIKNSVVSQHKGTSMSCNLPISKTSLILDVYSSEAYKYCDGSMKDMRIQELQQIGQAIWKYG